MNETEFRDKVLGAALFWYHMKNRNNPFVTEALKMLWTAVNDWVESMRKEEEINA